MVLTFFCSHAAVVVQPDSVSSKFHIENLKNSVLFVVLPSHYNKIRKMEDLSQSVELAEEERHHLTSEIRLLISERNLSNSILIKAFQQHYDFSSILFIYDYELNHIRNGTDSINILTDSIQFKKIPLPETYYFAMNQKSDPSNSTNIRVWIIADHKMKTLPDPFPKSISISPVKKFFRGLFNKKQNELTRNFEDLAVKMDQTFADYYLSSQQNPED